MIASLKIRKDFPLSWLVPGLSIFYAIICLTQLHGYLNWTSFNFIIGVMGLPFILDTSARAGSPLKYAIAVLVFCSIYVVVPIKTSLYFAIVSACLLLYASQGGRNSVPVGFTLALMSPVAKFFADSFSFPVRLKLTALAGEVMRFMSRDVWVEGNVINLNGTDFSVDPACMGMNMLVSSLLCAFLILGLQQKRQKKQLALHWILIVLTGAILLNVFSNLLRIIILVWFRILPDQWLHEVTGIACLCIYVLLPMNVCLQWFVRKWGRPWREAAERSSSIARVHHVGAAFVILTAVLLARTSSPRPSANPPVLMGFSGSALSDGVLKLSSPNALIYLKDLKGFYDSEHNPMLCWTGEGYLFSQVKEERIRGLNVVTGTLTKGKTVLQTAWWYSNGREITSGGIDWRVKAIRNRSSFSIVNVTTNDRDQLSKQIVALTTNANLNRWLERSNR